jgi:hypothetical protein
MQTIQSSINGELQIESKSKKNVKQVFHKKRKEKTQKIALQKGMIEILLKQNT